MRWQCTACDEWHEGLPDLFIPLPDYVHALSEEERAARCVIGEELIEADEHRFVRGLLQVPVVGEDETLGYGVWLTLSQVNFERYKVVLETDEPSDDLSFVGWVSNIIHGYPAADLCGRLRIRGGGLRPLIELEPTDHPLSVDQREGITPEKAGDLAAPYLHG